MSQRKKSSVHTNINVVSWITIYEKHKLFKLCLSSHSTYLTYIILPILLSLPHGSTILVDQASSLSRIRQDSQAWITRSYFTRWSPASSLELLNPHGLIMKATKLVGD